MNKPAEMPLRTVSLFAQFLEDVDEEIIRATTKFPQPNASMCALTEEVGELAKALMDEPSERVWREAVQVAAMAARVACEGDPTLDATRRKRDSGPHPQE